MSANNGSEPDLIAQIAFLIAGAYAVFELDGLAHVPPAWRDGATGLAYLLLGAVALAVARKLMRSAGGFWRFLRSIRPSRAHGSASWASRRDARRAGLHGGRGLFIGAHQGRLIRFENETHSLVLAPAGAGKTVAAVMPQLAISPVSMLVTDLKGELAAITAKHRALRLGHRVLALNPPAGLGLEAESYNAVEIILDDLAHAPEDAVSDARALAAQLYPEPAKADANGYFRSGTRSILTFVILGLAVKAPEEANLVTAQRIVAEPAVLRQLMEDLRGDPALGGDVAAMAESLTAAASATPKEFQSFANGAAQALEPFSPSGRLAQMSMRCSFRFRALKEGPATIYLGCDMTRMKVFAPVIALWNWAAMIELQRAPGGRPVLMLLDEASNFVIDGLPNALTALRGYGVRVYMVFQELEEIARVYGREAQATILSQTPLKQFFGIAGQSTAKLISEMLGNETIEAPSFSMGQDPFGAVGENRGFVSRPLLTPDEVRRLPSDQQIVFIANLPPILAAKIGYHEIAPIRDQLEPNPFHGAKRHRGRLKARLWPVAEALGAAARGPRPPSGARRPNPIWRVLGRLGAAGLGPGLRLALFGALAAMIYFYGLPHLRVDYAYVGRNAFAPDRIVSCTYLGWRSFVKPGPDCPMVLWRKYWRE